LWAINKKAEATKAWQLGSMKYGAIDVVAALANAANGNTDAALRTGSATMNTVSSPSLAARQATSNSGRSSPSPQTEASESQGPFRFEKPTNMPPQPADIQQMDPKSLEALVTVAARGMVQHGVGDQNVDQQIGPHFFSHTHTHTCGS